MCNYCSIRQCAFDHISGINRHVIVSFIFNVKDIYTNNAAVIRIAAADWHRNRFLFINLHFFYKRTARSVIAEHRSLNASPSSRYSWMY